MCILSVNTTGIPMIYGRCYLDGNLVQSHHYDFHSIRFPHLLFLAKYYQPMDNFLQDVVPNVRCKHICYLPHPLIFSYKIYHSFNKNKLDRLSLTGHIITSLIFYNYQYLLLHTEYPNHDNEIRRLFEHYSIKYFVR